jgi:hypothetical protein
MPRFASVLFIALTMLGTATARSELSVAAQCRQDFRDVDDQADLDMQEANRLIALLESEMADPALASSGQDFKDGLRDKIEAAKARRSRIFEKQHDDLNVIRARCKWSG